MQLSCFLYLFAALMLPQVIFRYIVDGPKKKYLLQKADEIEQTLQNSLEREVSTEYIGELVMDKLRAVDEVAYVRFASVYRQFKDIDTFMKELNKLLEGK